MATGIYRTRTEASGAEYATVNYGTTAQLESVTRTHYEQQGYQPPFENLPTKEQYEAAQKAKK